jgi:hypothetical protein
MESAYGVAQRARCIKHRWPAQHIFADPTIFDGWDVEQQILDAVMALTGKQWSREREHVVRHCFERGPAIAAGATEVPVQRRDGQEGVRALRSASRRSIVASRRSISSCPVRRRFSVVMTQITAMIGDA